MTRVIRRCGWEETKIITPGGIVKKGAVTRFNELLHLLDKNVEGT